MTRAVNWDEKQQTNQIRQMFCRPVSGSKLFDTLMVFLKEFLEKVDNEKKQQTTKKYEKFPREWGGGGQRVNAYVRTVQSLYKVIFGVQWN